MAIKYQALKGMDDLLPGEIEKWQWVETKARTFFESRGFKEIRTPVLESTELFSRSVGEASDIVHKEMFSFKDRGDRDISLRPEMTASVARAVIEHGLLKTNKSLRLYYLGPMFRAERPQAGRKRQFHQIGIEIINESNSEGWSVDFDAIFQLCTFLNYIGLNYFHLRLNDLGDLAQQRQLASKLKQYFLNQKSKLCSDCQYRLEKNVLRIFDCKRENCQPVIDKAPRDKPSRAFEERLIPALRGATFPFEVKIDPKIDSKLVRGLDYYNGTVFEVTTPALGAQDAVAGGGRYDDLYSDLGGDPTPCVGFSIGMERLIVALEKAGSSFSDKIHDKKTIYFAPLFEYPEFMPDTHEPNILTPYERVNEALTKLGESGFQPRYKGPLPKLSDHLKWANKMRAKYVVILGSEEINKKAWTVKDMDKQEQVEVPFENLISYFREIAI